MKRFYSENSKAITKFIVTHIVMSVLGIMVGLAVLARPITMLMFPQL